MRIADVFAVPRELRDHAERLRVEQRLAPHILVARPASVAFPKRVLVPNYGPDSITSKQNRDTGKDAPFWVVDSALLQQGPSYMLAKRLQQWRAMLVSHAQRWDSDAVVHSILQRFGCKRELLRSVPHINLRAAVPLRRTVCRRTRRACVSPQTWRLPPGHPLS